MTILDTNVLSEVTKPSPSDEVMRWLADQNPQLLFVTAITHAEIQLGVAGLPAGRRREGLVTAVEALLRQFEKRVLPFDLMAARFYPDIVVTRQAQGRPVAQFDAQIAAIARAHEAAIATRNTRDFEYCGVRVVNPWAA